MEGSRSAWKFLVEKCKRQYTTNKQVMLATRVVSLSTNGGAIIYINEYQLSFEMYITRLQEAYYTLAHYQNVVPAQFRLHVMIDGMQVSNVLTIDMDKVHDLDNLLVYWLSPSPTCSPRWQYNSLQGWERKSLQAGTWQPRCSPPWV